MKKQTTEPVKKPRPRGRKKQELAGSRVKLSFKRHLLPPLAGLLVAFLVFGFFNSQLLSGRIAYYLFERDADIETLNNLVAISTVDKNAPPKLIINEVNVAAPVIFGLQSNSESLFQKALRDGVVHYPNTAQPGQPGNVVIFGHSSGQWWAPGDFKFVFTHLDKLKTSDRIFLEFAGTRYIYRVYSSSVVPPNDLSVLNQGQDKILTLITCTPVGTSSNRLIIKAKQVVPRAELAPVPNEVVKPPSQAAGQLPSNSSSFWNDFLELF